MQRMHNNSLTLVHLLQVYELGLSVQYNWCHAFRIPVKLQIPNPISNYSLFNGYTADLSAIILIDAIAQISV